MPKKSNKYYVVWVGRDTGVFGSWADCKAAVEGHEGAKYKSFASKELAQAAFEEGAEHHIGKAKGRPDRVPSMARSAQNPGGYILNSIAVDAACNMATGQMEYQGVYTDGGQLLFHQGPFEGGSNNIGEFLAIVHALAWCQKHRLDLPIYTDSHTAMVWVRNKRANTKVKTSHKNKKLFELLQRAEEWLAANSWQNKLLKWNTEAWGEIPADFGRK